MTITETKPTTEELVAMRRAERQAAFDQVDVDRAEECIRSVVSALHELGGMFDGSVCEDIGLAVDEALVSGDAEIVEKARQVFALTERAEVLISAVFRAYAAGPNDRHTVENYAGQVVRCLTKPADLGDAMAAFDMHMILETYA